MKYPTLITRASLSKFASQNRPDRVDCTLFEWVDSDENGKFSKEADLNLRMSWNQLQDLIAQNQQFLHQKGFKKGDTILLFLAPGLPFIPLLLACFSSGIICSPCAPSLQNLTKERVSYLISSGKCTGCIVDPDLNPFFPSSVLSEHPNLRLVQSQSFSSLSGIDGSKYDCTDLTPDSICMLQYSSGSTGMPKPVALTHKNFLHNCVQIINLFDLKPTERGLSWLPFYHDMGLIGHVLVPLLVLGTQYLFSPTTFLKKPIFWLQMMSKYKVHISGAPDFAYSRIADSISSGLVSPSDLDLSNWRVAFCGAEPIRSDTWSRFCLALRDCSLNPSIFMPLYGMAEATLLISGFGNSSSQIRFLESPSTMPLSFSSSETSYSVVCLGKTHPDANLLIVDPETLQIQPPMTIGEIWIQSPSVTAGYYCDTENTSSTFRAFTADQQGPFLRTGDLGFVDKEKKLYFTSRLKDLVILSGSNYGPQEIEQCVEQAHPYLRKGNCAAFNIDSKSRNSSVLAIVIEIKLSKKYIPYDEQHDIIWAIQKRLHDNMGLAVATNDIALVSARSLPKTSSGKIRRAACRELMIAGKLSRIPSTWIASLFRQFSFETLSLLFKFAWHQFWKMLREFYSSFFSGLLPSSSKPSKQEQFPNPKIPSKSNLVSLPPLNISTSNEEQIVQYLTEIVSKITKIPKENLSPDESLLSYGISSVDAIQLIGILESQLGERFPPHLLFQHDTLYKLASFLKSDFKSTLQQSRVVLVEPNRFQTGPHSGGCAHILALGTHVPSTTLSQEELFSNFFTNSTALATNPEATSKAKNLFMSSLIKQRHLCTNPKELACVISTEERNNIFVKQAPILAVSAARSALSNWNGNPMSITHVISCSCTGTIVPGLEFHLVQQLKLNPSTQRFGLNFMGCFGGGATLRMATNIALADPKARVLVVCTELCTLHIQKEDLAVDNLVASAIFGDGAAACIVGQPSINETSLLKIHSAGCYACSDSTEKIQWNLSNTGWRVGLSPDIPFDLMNHIRPFSSAFIPSSMPLNSLYWAIHPGGKAIISCIEKECDLDPSLHTASTHSVLSSYGNMSSASIFFVLQHLLQQKTRQFNHIFCTSFGPGLALEGALFEFV